MSTKTTRPTVRKLIQHELNVLSEDGIKCTKIHSLTSNLGSLASVHTASARSLAPNSETQVYRLRFRMSRPKTEVC